MTIAAGVEAPSTIGATENLGREKLPWGDEVWARVDRAVHAEGKRTRIGRRFLPVVPMVDALTAPADTIASRNGLLAVDEAAVTPLIEIWVEFALTKQQVEREAELCTAVTLAMRAANVLAQGEDLLLLQGDAGFKKSALFKKDRIHSRAGPGPAGLSIEGALQDPKEQVVPVPLSDPGVSDPGARRYGEESFGAVEKGYSKLQEHGHYGPYALVFPTVPYADSHAPLKTTLIMPADRILPLVDERFYGTGTLPAFNGVLLSLGGNTLDLIVGRDAITAFVQEDNEGLYRFRVFERFALRDKDRTGRIVLRFQSPD
jgi:uncharacterized linocin/CFP29 family protein